MNKSKDQLLYDLIFQNLIEQGYDVYDFLPPVEVKYPFIHLGEVSMQPIPTKSVWLGEAEIIINVWGSGNDRKKVSDIMNKIIKENTSFSIFMLIPSRTNLRILRDNTTSNNLWHGIINLTYKCY